MNQEVEIKVKIKDPKKAEEKILKLGRLKKTRKQVDKYFVPPHKDYFAVDSTFEYLRVRFEEDKHHLGYHYCHLDEAGNLITTDEYEVVIDDPQIAQDILEKVGMTHRVSVKKDRKYYEADDFDITIDNVEGLGCFMEIEAKKDFGSPEKIKQACYDLLIKLGIEYEECPSMGYPDMILKKSS